MPGPDGLEAVHERDVLPQIGEQPKAGRCDKVGDAKENDTEDGHEEEEAEQAQESPTEVVHAEAKLEGPEGVADDDEDEHKGKDRVQLALNLAALPEPRVVHLFLGLLLRLDADGPETLDALRLLRAVVVAFVRVGLCDAQSKHRHGKKLKGVLERRAIGDLGQLRVLLARLLVGGGL